MKTRENPSVKHRFASFYLFFTLLLIPGFAFVEALNYLDKSSAAVNRSVASQNLARLKAELKIFNDEGLHLSRMFIHSFFDCSNARLFAAEIEKKAAVAELRLTWAAWDAEGRLAATNVSSSDNFFADWKKAGSDLRALLKQTDFPGRLEVNKNLGILFGRQFYIPVREAQSGYVSQKLFSYDIALNSSLTWLASNDRYTVAIKIAPSELLKKTGLRDFVELNSSPALSFAFFKGDGVRAQNPALITLAKEAFNRLNTGLNEVCVNVDDYMVNMEQTDQKSYLMMIQRCEQSPLKSEKKVMLIIIFLSLFFLIRKISSAGLEDYSLLGQISILLFISTGLPCIFLSFASIGYFNQKQMLLINEKNQEMIDYLHRIDNGALLENSRLLLLIAKGIKDLRPVLLGYLPEKSDLQMFRHYFNPEVISSIQFVKVNPENKPGNNSLSAGRPPQEIEMMEILGFQVLSLMNESPVSYEIPADKAYMIESYVQKPVMEVIHDLVRWRESINKVGWGSVPHLFFAAPIKVFNDTFDHFVLITFFAEAVIKDIVTRASIASQKNSWGGEIYFQIRNHTFPQDKYEIDRNSVDLLLARCSPFPPPEPLVIEFRGKKHLFVGLTGNFLTKVNMGALFPMERIETLIKSEARELAFLWLIAIALIFCLIIIFYLHLLRPVTSLHHAAIALEQRDFAFRLEDLGDDEFGEMANIFNSSIADFEELQIASIVQTRLLPSREARLGSFSFYGASLPMAQLGGDYFDYFAVDDKHFVVLLGDVAGHGVGASLIMAMAKAGVICMQGDSGNPAEVLRRLHLIVHAVRNKMQRKVMTFQYLCMNNETGIGIYSNAGACSPVLVTGNGSETTEISLLAPVLGGFAKSKFANLEVKVGHEDAVVFYTDGFVEARNNRGEEMGYDGFQKLLRECWDAEAKVYYEKVWNRFNLWLAGEKAQDDLTMIILVRNRR